MQRCEIECKFVFTPLSAVQQYGCARVQNAEMCDRHCTGRTCPSLHYLGMPSGCFLFRGRAVLGLAPMMACIGCSVHEMRYKKPTFSRRLWAFDLYASCAPPVCGPELALIGDCIWTLLISGPGPSWATPYDGLSWMLRP